MEFSHVLAQVAFRYLAVQRFTLVRARGTRLSCGQIGSGLDAVLIGQAESKLEAGDVQELLFDAAIADYDSLSGDDDNEELGESDQIAIMKITPPAGVAGGSLTMNKGVRRRQLQSGAAALPPYPSNYYATDSIFSMNVPPTERGALGTPAWTVIYDLDSMLGASGTADRLLVNPLARARMTPELWIEDPSAGEWVRARDTCIAPDWTVDRSLRSYAVTVCNFFVGAENTTTSGEIRLFFQPAPVANAQWEPTLFDGFGNRGNCTTRDFDADGSTVLCTSLAVYQTPTWIIPGFGLNGLARCAWHGNLDPLNTMATMLTSLSPRSLCARAATISTTMQALAQWPNTFGKYWLSHLALASKTRTAATPC